jgi:Uncharacterised nucleotidyltransferase/Transglutaminase-like superfamily
MLYLRTIEQYLLTGQDDGLKALDFQAMNLGAYAYVHLSVQHVAKQSLRGDYLVASVRHQKTRDNLFPLISAWLEADIEIAFLKGFRLAEFDYGHPAERFYGDVDVLILPSDVESAKHIAVTLGWSLLFDEDDFVTNDLLWKSSHAAVLRSSDHLVLLELHCLVLQTRNKLSGRLAQAFWKASVPVDWHGTQVKQLQPVDVMLCMYLNRAWGDYYGRKPHDILDVLTLLRKHSLTRNDLEARAKELGVRLALAVAMRTCDPWLKKLRLGRRSRFAVWWDALCAYPNWGSDAVDVLKWRLRKAPFLIVDVIEGWRLVRFAIKTLARESDLNVIVQSMMPAKSLQRENTQVKTFRLERGVRWALRLMSKDVDACVPRSLALFHALRKQGLEVSFVSGVRRNNSKLEGHAWLELHGKPIVGLGDENAPQLFKENFRYPTYPLIDDPRSPSDN